MTPVLQCFHGTIVNICKLPHVFVMLGL